MFCRDEVPLHVCVNDAHKNKSSYNNLVSQDLIKHTSPEHQDYLQLHMALSKLENVAYQLNEKKRSSEEKLAASVILSKLRIKNPASVLLRQDDVSEVVSKIRGYYKQDLVTYPKANKERYNESF